MYNNPSTNTLNGGALATIILGSGTVDLSSGTNTLSGGALATIILGSVIFSVVAIIFSAVIYWRIFSKAGYSGAMGLLMFIPIANIIVLCILAFGEWPLYRELNYLRQRVAQGDQYSPFRQEFPAKQFPPAPQYPQYDQPQPPQYPQT